jgi:hypothetical protein
MEKNMPGFPVDDICIRAALPIAFCLVCASAWASPELLTNDPKRPVQAISKDLGIRADQFTHCFEHVRPAAQGERPTSERVHANKAVLLSCLQKANPAITNEKLDEVMDRYRPGGREAQRPER